MPEGTDGICPEFTVVGLTKMDRSVLPKRTVQNEHITLFCYMIFTILGCINSINYIPSLFFFSRLLDKETR